MSTPQAPHGAQLAAGAVLLDRYRVVEAIAAGGHSMVYRGHDRRLDRPVCIKVFTRYPADAGISRTAYEHFVQEAFALSRLTHPHTLRIYDFGHLPVDRDGDGDGDGTGLPFHVSEYMDGGTLAQLVRERGAQPWADAIPITAALGLALAEAHALGIIHRDLKPQNILFAQAAGLRLPKLADFGIAKWMDDTTSENRAGDTQVVAGAKLAMYSPSWAAPEQLAGQPVGPSTLRPGHGPAQKPRGGRVGFEAHVGAERQFRLCMQGSGGGHLRLGLRHLRQRDPGARSHLGMGHEPAARRPACLIIQGGNSGRPVLRTAQ